MVVEEIKEIDGLKVVDYFCGNSYEGKEVDGKRNWITCLHLKSEHKGRAYATDECYIDTATGEPVMKAEVEPNMGKCKKCECDRFNVAGYVLEDGTFIHEDWVWQCAECGVHFTRKPPASLEKSDRWKYERYTPPDKYKKLFCDEHYKEGFDREVALFEKADKIIGELSEIASELYSIRSWGHPRFEKGIENEKCWGVETDHDYVEISVGDMLEALDNAFS